jgi:ribosomal protein S18 acetylase RimI-like enzyme
VDARLCESATANTARMLNDHTITLAAPADAADIARMSRDLIEQGLPWSWTAPRVRRSIADPQTNVAVVRDIDNELRAFGIMKYGDDDAHLLLLAVDAARRRLGLGTALVQWLERVAQAAGVARLQLEARATNAPARAFYERLGYAQTQLMPGYYQGREASVRFVKTWRP